MATAGLRVSLKTYYCCIARGDGGELPGTGYLQTSKWMSIL